MSAMSASPVKPPVLPPSGVNVQPSQVVPSPQKVVLGTPLPIPSSLTISPAKPANMNHATMPLSLIADHKITSQYPPQSQPSIPPPVSAMQPISQPLPRTPEKPKELSAPAPVPSKPTSNGMESLITPNQAPILPPTVQEPQQSAGAGPVQKTEALTPSEPPETKLAPLVPEKSSEPPVAAIAPPVEADMEKKEALPAKPVESANAPAASSTSFQESKASPGNAALPKISSAVSTSSTTGSTPPVSNVVACPAPASTPTPAAAPEKSVAPPPPSEQTTPQPVVPPTPSISRAESSLPQSKPEMKVATIPRQAAKRKREPKVSTEQPEVIKENKDDDRKSKRVRLPTQPYQSPIPELTIIAKIDKKIKSTPTKAADDKLIVFYKNEFLAVRNAEGGFYVCQAMQNIYKSSPRIRIRWLSQEEGKDTYSPDFYDHTDFDCILTNLNLDKVDKEKFRLPDVEQQRTESILKRALDVEKGVSEKPPVTEEHPDGLDLSLFRDESQLKKSKGRGKKLDGEKSDDKESNSTDEEVEEEKKPKKTSTKSNKRKKKTVKKKPALVEKKAVAKTTDSSNKSTVQPKKKPESREVNKRKISVSSNSQSQPPDKRTRKSDPSSQSSEKTNKTRSVEGVAAAAKSRRDRRVKTRK